MIDTLLPQLKTPEARRAITDSVTVLLERWSIHESKKAELLGLANMSTITRGGLLPDDPAVMERAGYLLAIGRALKRFHEDQAAADWWVTSPCEALGGFSPLSVMLGGLDGIKRVCRLLEGTSNR